MPSRFQIQELSTTLRKAASQQLRRPPALAALASLGVHGLLFWGLPLLPFAALEATEPEAQQTVDLMELTPAEQSRLPDFSDAQLDLPPIAREPLPKPSNSFSRSAPLPPPPPASSSNSFFNPPLPTWNFPMWTFPSQPEVEQAQPAPAKPPAEQPRVAVSPTPQAAATPQPPASPQAPTPEQSPAPEVAANPNAVSPQPQGATPTQTPRTPDTILQARVDEIRARREQLAEQRTLLAADPTGTGEGEPRERYTGWFEKAVGWLGKDYDGKNAKSLEIPAAYPALACTKGMSGAAIVGVVVDAEGKVVTDPIAPEILQGSGYRIFNQQALEAASAHQFEATGKREAYQVLVQFNYSQENCPPEASPPAQGPAQG